MCSELTRTLIPNPPVLLGGGDKSGEIESEVKPGKKQGRSKVLEGCFF